MKKPSYDKFEIKYRLSRLFTHLFDMQEQEILRKELKPKLADFNLNPKLILWMDFCFGGSFRHNYANELAYYDLAKMRSKCTVEELTAKLYDFLFEFGYITKAHLVNYNTHDLPVSQTTDAQLDLYKIEPIRVHVRIQIPFELTLSSISGKQIKSKILFEDVIVVAGPVHEYLCKVMHKYDKFVNRYKHDQRRVVISDEFVLYQVYVDHVYEFDQSHINQFIEMTKLMTSNQIEQCSNLTQA